MYAVVGKMLYNDLFVRVLSVLMWAFWHMKVPLNKFRVPFFIFIFAWHWNMFISVIQVQHSQAMFFYKCCSSEVRLCFRQFTRIFQCISYKMCVYLRKSHFAISSNGSWNRVYNNTNPHKQTCSWLKYWPFFCK